MKVYLDNAATTAVTPSVAKEIQKYLTQTFGNPSSLHAWGQAAHQALEKARGQVAAFFGTRPDQLIFTGGATESINLSHKGLVEWLRRTDPRFKTRLPHLITTPIEHKAVLEVYQHLVEAKLAEVTILPVDKDGLVKIADLEKALRPETALVSVMYVNNEVGTIEPIAEIGAFLKKYNQDHPKNKVYFHTDATQGVQYLDCRVDKLGVDLLSFTGHKLHAPKGVGGLFVRKGVKFTRQQDGGSQEDRRRAGTENVAYIMGLAKALENLGSLAERKKTAARVAKLRDRLIKGATKIEGVKLTGPVENRAPHLASFVIEGVEGEAILLSLDHEGIAASSGSACTSGSLKPSHVLLAMGMRPEVAHGSLRFSLGPETTAAKIDYVLKVLPKVITRIRKMVPDLKGFHG